MANTAAILDVIVKAQTSKAAVELKKFDKQLQQTSKSAKDTDRNFEVADKKVTQFGSSVGDTNQRMMLFKNTVGLVKFPAMIAGLGGAAQAAAAASAGVGGLVSALAPLSGLLAAYPALLGAFGQAMGVTAVAGLSDVTDAVGGLNEKLDETADEFKNLSPQAQEFARGLQSAKAPLLDIQKTVQRPLFEGLNEGLDSARKNMPALKSVAGDTASVMGDLAREAGRFVGREGFGRDFEKVGANNAQLLGRLGEAGLHFGDALRHVMVVARPLIDFLGKGIVEFSKWIEEQAKAGRESGRMAEFFERTERVVRQLVNIGGSLGKVFLDIGHAARPLGEDIMKVLVDQAQKLAQWTSSNQGKLRQYFEDARGPLAETGKLLKDVVSGFFSLSQTEGLGKFISQIRKDLLPAILEMTKSTTKQFGPVLIDTLTQVVKLLTNFMGSNGPLTSFVQLIGRAAEALNSLFESIPALAQAASAALTGFSIFKLLGFSSGGRMGETLGQKLGGGIKGGLASVGLGVFVGSLISSIFTSGGIQDTIEGKGATWGTKFGDAFAGKAKPKIERAISTFDLDVLKALRKPLADLQRWFEETGAGGSEALDRLADKAERARERITADFHRITAELDNFSNTWAQSLGEINRRVDRNMADIERSLGLHSKRGRQAVSDNFLAAEQAIKNSMKSGEISAEKGAKAIHQVLLRQLKSYGIKDAEGFLNRSESVQESGGEGHRGLQKGGMVPGQGSGDRVPLHVGGRLAAMVEPGEYVSVANRKATHALMKANEAVPRFQEGGVMRLAKGGGATGMAAMVQAANAYEAKGYPYAWGGGHGDIAWPDTEPVDCSGAVSAVLSAAGLLDTPMVSGALASWGKAGTGPLTVYANSGHTFMSLDGKFFGTSSSNPGGGAGWMSDPGASYISGFAKRTTDVAGGGAIAAAAGNVKLPRFSSDFGLGLMVAQGLNNMAAGTEKTMNKRLAARVPGGSFGGGQPLADISGQKFVATSYGPPWGGIQGTGVTATGVNLMDSPQIYGVAVDPDVIALGSKMRIGPNPFNYGGLFKAFDTGGAIQGNRIDFYDWRGRDEQLGWGTRNVQVEMARRGGLLKLAEGGVVQWPEKLLGPDLPRILQQIGADPESEALQGLMGRIRGAQPNAVNSSGELLGKLFDLRQMADQNLEWSSLAAQRDQDIPWDLEFNAGKWNIMNEKGKAIESFSSEAEAVAKYSEMIEPLLGLFHGHTEQFWRSSELDNLWSLRKRLILAARQMKERREQMHDALQIANQRRREWQHRVNDINKEGHTPGDLRPPDPNKDIQEWNQQSDKDRQAKGRAFKKEGGKLAGDRAWASDGSWRLVAVGQGAKRVLSALEQKIIPGLEDGEDRFNAARVSLLNDHLATVQGTGMSMRGLDNRPPVDELLNQFAGEINASAFRLQELRADPRFTDTTEEPPEPQTWTIGQLLEFAQALRYGAFSQYGYAGEFAKGGFIPRGQYGLVGEKGPEYMTGPAQITPAAPAATPMIFADVYIGGEKIDERVQAEITGQKASDNLRLRARHVQR